jgi:hypothetical protein
VRLFYVGASTGTKTIARPASAWRDGAASGWARPCRRSVTDVCTRAPWPDERPVVVEITTRAKRAQPHDRLGASRGPARAGATHPIFDKVAASASCRTRCPRSSRRLQGANVLCGPTWGDGARIPTWVPGFARWFGRCGYGRACAGWMAERRTPGRPCAGLWTMARARDLRPRPQP